ncbi:MAG: hypothetical protein K6G36_00275 [Candidatus Saccharibacteria bacterium]|nr:hypothetical protein [Candidatus Saccharibacteria bacterium]
MKHKHKKKSNNLILKILFVLAIIVVAAVLIVKYVDFNKIFNKTPDEEPTPAQVTPTPDPEPTPTSEPIPDPEPTPTPGPEPENKTPQYDGGNPNNEENITGVITYAGVSNNQLMIRVNIDQYLNGGECNLILNLNGATKYGASARIIDAASTSTCEGFNVPVSELPSGKYQIQINLTSDRKSGSITGEVSL